MRKWIPLLIVVAAVAFSAAVYGRLPDQIATHWDAEGSVNGWSSRPFGAWFLPAIMLVVALMLPVLPSIDPRGANFEKFRGTYELIVTAVIAMLGVMHVMVLGVALGWPIAMGRVVPVLVGALFILLGNVLPRARPNWWFGIRTPWTLSNDRVWERTHRVGGYLFVIAGALLMLAAFLPLKTVLPLIIGMAVSLSLGLMIYSFVIWKQETLQ